MYKDYMEYEAEFKSHVARLMDAHFGACAFMEKCVFLPQSVHSDPGRDIIGQNRLGAQDGHIGTDGTYRPLQI